MRLAPGFDRGGHGGAWPSEVPVAQRSEALLQGRTTYQVSAAAWPERAGDPFVDWINSVQKYVVSDTLTT